MDNISNSAANFGQPKMPCVGVNVNATHDFDVPDYTVLGGMGVGKVVRSRTFSVGGFEWILEFYPDGKTDDCKDYASAFLRCLKPSNDLDTSFTLNLLSKGSKGMVTCFTSTKHTFSPTKFSCGYVKFVPNSKMKDKSRYPFIIRCHLTVIKEYCKNFIAVPEPNLKEQLESMWKDGVSADVTFSVSGQVFNAHRCVLAARSSVFKAELLGPMKTAQCIKIDELSGPLKEKTTQCIKIDDIEPQIFKALLHYIYTDSLIDRKEGETAELLHLIVAADRYGLERLRAMCVSQLCDSIVVENAATTLVLAEQHLCIQLQEACIDFIAARNMLSKVMATDGFNHLVVSCPHLMKEILAKISQDK